jgi:hypothetical protein
MFKRTNPGFYWLYMPAILLILVTAITSYYSNIPISRFTRDPLAITGGNPFLGIISNIGVIIWSATIAICLFAYTLSITSKKSNDVLRFILFGGLISLILLLDDLFMLHERIYPKYFGIHEISLFLVYGALVLFYLFKFRKIVIKTDLVYLLLTAIFFSMSIVVDLLPEKTLYPWHHLFEDGFKFLGIVSWFGYLIAVCFKEVRSVAYAEETNRNVNTVN